jgi:hypothetical protein
VPVIALFTLLGILGGFGWLARARRLRAERFAHIRQQLVHANAGDDRFISDSIDGLPVPAAIYLRHALVPGTPLPRSVDIRMSGTMRVSDNDWVPFTARQLVCAERGFLWEARIAAMRHVEVCGAEWLFGEDGGSEYALAGWWPVLEQRSPDVARSAVGRLMVELIWLPSALTPQRGAQWTRGDSDRAVVRPAGNATPMTVVVGDDGRLREASVIRRRLNASGETSVCAYGVSVEAERQFGSIRVPTQVVAAWGIGTDDRTDFLRMSVDDIRWL